MNARTLRSPGTDDVLVIGAGPAGIAVSACLRRAGVAHAVVEQHAAQYRNAGRFRDKRVLVVGSGNSAAMIAQDLAMHDVDTTLAVRPPVHVVPRDPYGVPAQRVMLVITGPLRTIASEARRVAQSIKNRTP